MLLLQAPALLISSSVAGLTDVAVNETVFRFET